jgi:hypothetical protein
VAGSTPSCHRGAATTEMIGRPSRQVAWRAVLMARTPVYDGVPRGRPRAHGSVGPGAADALMVLGARRDRRGRCWLSVRLPSRPNDAKGWIPAERVLLRENPWRLIVSTSKRSVRLLRAGETVGSWRVVVGAPATPTPRGTFAIARAIRWRPHEFLGSWVFTLTAHSEVLARFDGGDGRVALHGRGGASLAVPLGLAASHGCVRLANRTIEGIARRVGAADLPGTPVVIS